MAFWLSIFTNTCWPSDECFMNSLKRPPSGAVVPIDSSTNVSKFKPEYLSHWSSAVFLCARSTIFRGLEDIPCSKKVFLITIFSNRPSSVKFFFAHHQESGDPLLIIFIADDLSKFVKNPAYITRVAKRWGEITDTWISNSKDLIKDRHSRILHIRSHYYLTSHIEP